MKKSIVLMMLLFTLAGCSVSKKSTRLEAPEKELKSRKLVQTPDAYLTETKDSITERLKVPLTTTFVFEQKTSERPTIRATFSILPAHPSQILDTVMFINLDGEFIKIVSKGDSVNGRFTIQENLWVSVVHAKKIECRLYLAHEDIDIVWNLSDKNKLAEFFRLAIEQRDVLFPAIPQGEKKW